MKETLRGDLFGALTSAVVALPLALAFGVASGLGPVAGLYGAIIVGFLAAILGGTPAQVSGPTGPMTVVMAVIVAQHADRLELAFAIVLLGGAIQALFGVLRLGRYISYTPYSVISGFMSGIGLIIILLQVRPFLGLSAGNGSPVEAIALLTSALPELQIEGTIIALASLSVMVFWPARLGRYLPSPLVALALGISLSLTLLPGAQTLEAAPIGLPAFRIPTFGLGDIATIIQPAFVLALLGSIDSLLTSLVADSITRTQHNPDRELIGQGVGNMAAGLFGALPGAGATMRTVVNVRAGGRSRLSGAFHAVLLLSLALGLGPMTAYIPNAALAGILIKVGWDIIDWGYLIRIAKAPREKVVVMLVTFALTVFVDLVTAVAVGLILAGFVTARWMEAEELKGVIHSALAGSSNAETTATEDVLVISLRGRFSYASARALTKHVGAIAAGYKALILDFTAAERIDTSTALAIDEILASVAERSMPCAMCGLSGTTLETLASLGVLDHVLPQNILHDIDAASRQINADLATAEP